MAKNVRSIKKRNNKQNRKTNTKKNSRSVKNILSHIKSSIKNLRKIGGNRGCNTSGETSCFPNVNVEQYKAPCNFLPLDGPKHNVYPLSHNPHSGAPVGNSVGGLRKNRKSKRKQNKRKTKKGGNSYLSVNNNVSGYTRYGAAGKNCGPNWKYTNSMKGGFIRAGSTQFFPIDHSKVNKQIVNDVKKSGGGRKKKEKKGGTITIGAQG